MTSIPSASVADRWYSVKNGVCQCPASVYGRRCKHLAQAESIEEREREIMERGKAMTTGAPADPADMAGPQNVEQALAYVYSKVDYVQKEKKQGLGYSFAGEAAILNVVRPAMVEAGLTIRVNELMDVAREHVPTKNGGSMTYTTLRAVVRFAHAPSGSYVDVQALGEGADVGDKSANKAMTGALKYAIRQTFALETGDDPDSTSSAEYERPSQQRPTQAQRPEPAPAKAKWSRAALRDTLAEEGMKVSDLAPVIGPVTSETYADVLDAWFAAHPNETVNTLVVLAAQERVTS